MLMDFKVYRGTALGALLEKSRKSNEGLSTLCLYAPKARNFNQNGRDRIWVVEKSWITDKGHGSS